MAKHTFVTVSHLTGDETRMVDILTRADVKKIVAEVIGLEVGDIDSRIKMQERKLAKVVEQAAAVAKDAAEAKEEVRRLVETARETFRKVIEEMLAPHYHLLEQYLGIELPMEKSNRKIGMASKPCSPGAVKNRIDDAKQKSTPKTCKSAVRKKPVMPSSTRPVVAKRNIAKKRPTSLRKAK